MYIVNPEVLSNLFICKKLIANYLTRNKIPILSIQSGDFYFADTQELREMVKNMPITLKIFGQRGWKSG